MKTRQGDGVKRLILVLGCAYAAWASGPDLERAHKLYSLTEFQQSLEVLQAVPNKDAAVYELMGRNYYGQGEFKKATEVARKGGSPGTGKLGYLPVAGPGLRPARRDFQYAHSARIRHEGAPVFREGRADKT